MSAQIRDILFYGAIFALIFNNIPTAIQMNFIGGVVGSKLAFYPVILGFIYTAYCQYKYGNVFVKLPVIKKYILVYSIVALFSLTLGLYNYPYFELIINGPINQIEKLPKVLAWFSEYGIDLNFEITISFWMVVRVIKTLALEIFYTFIFSYMIYCWYKDDWYDAIKILGKASLCSLAVIVIYCIVEVSYLVGNETAKSILENITPYLHTVKDNGTWWPPLLWKNQLRSIFAEPSYFGIYSAFCLPFLWLGIIKNKLNNKDAYVYIILTISMTFLLILTKARTGFMLHVGELLIFSFLLIYTRNTALWKKSIVVFLCSMIAFVGGNLFISKCMITKKAIHTPLKTSISNYIDSNATSLINPDKRSNRARYSVMEADVNVGLEHPLFGIGSGLRAAYVIDAFSERALNDSEVKYWIRNSKRLGILKSGIPKLGEYTSRFCETGMLGLLVFLFPAFYLAKCMLYKLKNIEKDVQVYYVLFLTSFAGILASGIGDTINITYCYWVLLGLGYAMCFGKQDKNESKKEIVSEKI